MPKFKCDILSKFQTMWSIKSLKGVSGLYQRYRCQVDLWTVWFERWKECIAHWSGMYCPLEGSSLVVHIFVKVQSCYQTNYAQQLTRRKILQSHSDNAQNLQCSKYQDLLSTSCHLFSPQKSWCTTWTFTPSSP